MPVTLKDILQAQQRIAGGVWLSPCQESHELSRLIGGRIFCKLDNLQHAGSFKERGARKAMLLLSAAQRRRGVIAASAGNHALGLACHGGRLEIPVTVVMPKFAPLTKSSICTRLGARVILFGDTFGDAKAEADPAISERPGGLANLSRVGAAAGANVKEIIHERAFAGTDVSVTHRICTIETRDRAHVRQVRGRMASKCFRTTANFSNESHP